MLTILKLVLLIALALFMHMWLFALAVGVALGFAATWLLGGAVTMRFGKTEKTYRWFTRIA